MPLFFWFAVLMFVTDGKSICNLPDWFAADLTLFSIPFPVAAILFTGNGTLLGIPVPMILFVLWAVLVAVIMSHAPSARPSA
jgi:ribose/xylose/arabinose/galactoside ABC-type transport system permease subunit